MRKEYFPSGALKSEVYIVFKMGWHYTTIIDYDTGKEKWVTIELLNDFPVGLFTSYYDNINEIKVKMEGMCQNGQRIGEWTFTDKNGQKSQNNLNET